MDLACFYIPHFAAWALAHRWSEDSASGDRNPVIAACAHGRVLATTPALGSAEGPCVSSCDMGANRDGNSTHRDRI